MGVQLHRKFTDEQAKERIEKFLRKEVDYQRRATPWITNEAVFAQQKRLEGLAFAEIAQHRPSPAVQPRLRLQKGKWGCELCV